MFVLLYFFQDSLLWLVRRETLRLTRNITSDNALEPLPLPLINPSEMCHLRSAGRIMNLESKERVFFASEIEF